MNYKKIDIRQQHQTKGRPLILDGAMGSLLQSEDFDYSGPLWTSKLNIHNPEKVKSLHKAYIEAGAEIITTNTFGTNPAALNRDNFNISIDDLVSKSVNLAIESKLNDKIIVAGSNAPAEDCYQVERTLTLVELDYNHKKHVDLLWENGCDVILNDTQSHWDEIKIISKYCSQNKIQFILSLFFTPELKLLSNEPLEEAVDFVKDYSPAAIGFNCISPQSFDSFAHTQSLDYNWGVYLNCGAGKFTDKTISCGIGPNDYLKHVKKWLPSNPLFIGSCCGSNPLHTKAIRDYFNEVY